MNIILYLVASLLVVSLLSTLIVVIRSSHHKNNEVAWLQGMIESQTNDIKDLHDRLMAKSLNEYKLWTQQPDEIPPPEVEEPFNDSEVGRITGKENLVDA